MKGVHQKSHSVQSQVYLFSGRHNHLTDALLLPVKSANVVSGFGIDQHQIGVGQILREPDNRSVEECAHKMCSRSFFLIFPYNSFIHSFIQIDQMRFLSQVVCQRWVLADTFLLDVDGNYDFIFYFKIHCYLTEGTFSILNPTIIVNYQCNILFIATPAKGTALYNVGNSHVKVCITRLSL